MAQTRAFAELGGQLLFGTDVGYMAEWAPKGAARATPSAAAGPRSARACGAAGPTCACAACPGAVCPDVCCCPEACCWAYSGATLPGLPLELVKYRVEGN